MVNVLLALLAVLAGLAVSGFLGISVLVGAATGVSAGAGILLVICAVPAVLGIVFAALMLRPRRSRA